MKQTLTPLITTRPSNTTHINMSIRTNSNNITPHNNKITTIMSIQPHQTVSPSMKSSLLRSVNCSIFRWRIWKSFTISLSFRRKLNFSRLNPSLIPGRVLNLLRSLTPKLWKSFFHMLWKSRIPTTSSKTWLRPLITEKAIQFIISKLNPQTSSRMIGRKLTFHKKTHSKISPSTSCSSNNTNPTAKIIKTTWTLNSKLK